MFCCSEPCLPDTPQMSSPLPGGGLRVVMVGHIGQMLNTVKAKAQPVEMLKVFSLLNKEKAFLSLLTWERFAWVQIFFHRQMWYTFRYLSTFDCLFVCVFIHPCRWSPIWVAPEERPASSTRNLTSSRRSPSTGYEPDVA